MKNRVRIVRMNLSITQEQLAKRVGATRQTIGLIEKGQYNPSLHLCMAIARELGKTLDELFWEAE
jgi:putative transcriptional regulator